MRLATPTQLAGRNLVYKNDALRPVFVARSGFARYQICQARAQVCQRDADFLTDKCGLRIQAAATDDWAIFFSNSCASDCEERARRGGPTIGGQLLPRSAAAHSLFHECVPPLGRIAVGPGRAPYS